MDSGLLSHKLPDIELLTLTTAYNEYDDTDIRHSQEYIPAGRHWAADDATVNLCTSPGTPTDSPRFAAAAAEFGSIAVALENQEDSLDSWASAESQAAAAESTNQQPETAGSRPSQQQLNTDQDACAASEEGKPAATQRQDQQSVLNISVPEKEAAAAAAIISRQHVDKLFQAVDVQQQQQVRLSRLHEKLSVLVSLASLFQLSMLQLLHVVSKDAKPSMLLPWLFLHVQEKKLALLELAAAAAASSSREVISEEEKQALREAGRAAQQAAQSQLAAALQETDEAVQQMDESSRVQWFKVG